MSKRYARNPGTDQIQAWKHAVAEHNKQKRRNRWKRPAQAYRPGMNVTTPEKSRP
jgi:hypothetical protein